jgi:integrase
LDALVAFSRGRKDHITVSTQKRIFRQTNHFLDWCVYEGQLESNPFHTVQLEGKVRPASYAVPTDEEVLQLLAATGERIHKVLLFCLLSGMRSGEASGLLAEDLVPKGNLGTFAHVRPNSLRQLKTDSAERLVPLHPKLQDLLPSLPKEGPLFPKLSVPIITKDFAILRKRLGLSRPGLVFHSSRKWFVTQCERAGVPEHYTASLVGHASARSENGLTYSIYSAGISDEQKRGIVDAIRLPK